MTTYYLLDTNCFYGVSENLKNKFKAIKDQIYVSAISAIEISKLSAKEFRKRQAALTVLSEIGANYILEDPDEIVRRCFGLPPETPWLTEVWFHEIAEVLKYASSYEEAINGYEREGNRYQLSAEVVAAWKKAGSAVFKMDVVSGLKSLREERLQKLMAGRAFQYSPGTPENKQEKNEVRDEMLRLVREEIMSSDALVLLGLAQRAGVVDPQTFDQVIAQEEDSSLDPLVIRAVETYQGGLETFIDAYKTYMSYMLQPGREPERNAMYDLDFFVHLDAHELPLVFVTKEKLWGNDLAYGPEARDRVLFYDDFVKMLSTQDKKESASGTTLLSPYEVEGYVHPTYSPDPF